MRRIILLGLFALLVGDASAQRRGVGFGRGGFSRGRATFSRGFGYGYLPYGDLPYDDGDSYGYASQAGGYATQPIIVVQPAPPPVFVKPPRPVRPVVTNYKWPAPDSSAPPQSEAESAPRSFGIVLRDGSRLSAVTVMASDDVLHYVDPDERHLQISMSEVDRQATLKLNRERNLTLYLPATPQPNAASAL